MKHDADNNSGSQFRYIAYVIAGIAGAAIGAVMTPIVIVPVLNAIGFSAVGPVAGEGWFSLYDHIPLNDYLFPTGCQARLRPGYSLP